MTLTHGLSKKHPLYDRWCGMRARCNNPSHASYPRYGARGVRVCARWDDFAAFLEDVGDEWPGSGHELHRLDEDGDYEPANCVWLTEAEHRGRPKSAAHRAKIAAAHKGRKKSVEHAAKAGRARRAPLNADWLRDAYQVRGLTIYEIAAEAGCGKSSVHRALKREGIGPMKDQLAQSLADVLKEET